jgi:5-methylcytosine-specific restriction endonuclease McrA
LRRSELEEGIMLRRAENVRVSHHAGLFTNKGPMTLHVGAKGYTIFRKVPLATYQQMLCQSHSYPVCFGRIGERAYWLFADRWHWENDNLAAEQVHALLVTRGQRQQATINRAMTMVSMQQDPAPAVRVAIPDDVKQLVWQRDGGRCRRCGANVELQFDHVIPLACGGASTLENLQVLCGPCNRRKGASVI